MLYHPKATLGACVWNAVALVTCFKLVYLHIFSSPLQPNEVWNLKRMSGSSVCLSCPPWCFDRVLRFRLAAPSPQLQATFGSQPLVESPRRAISMQVVGDDAPDLGL